MIKSPSLKENITNFQGVLFHYTDYLFCYPWWKQFYAVLDIEKQTFAIYKSKDLSHLYISISVATINEILMPSPDEFVIFYRFEYFRFKGQNQVDTEMWYDALKVLITALTKQYVQLLTDLKKTPFFPNQKQAGNIDIIKKPLPRPGSKKSQNKTKPVSNDQSSARNVNPLDDPQYSSLPKGQKVSPKKRYSGLNANESTNSSKSNTNNNPNTTNIPLYDGYLSTPDKKTLSGTNSIDETSSKTSGKQNLSVKQKTTVDGIPIKPRDQLTTNLFYKNEPVKTSNIPYVAPPKPQLYQPTDSMNSLIRNFNNIYNKNEKTSSVHIDINNNNNNTVPPTTTATTTATTTTTSTTTTNVSRRPTVVNKKPINKNNKSITQSTSNKGPVRPPSVSESTGVNPILKQSPDKVFYPEDLL